MYKLNIKKIKIDNFKIESDKLVFKIYLDISKKDYDVYYKFSNKILDTGILSSYNASYTSNINSLLNSSVIIKDPVINNEILELSVSTIGTDSGIIFKKDYINGNLSSIYILLIYILDSNNDIIDINSIHFVSSLELLLESERDYIRNSVIEYLKTIRNNNINKIIDN